MGLGILPVIQDCCLGDTGRKGRAARPQASAGPRVAAISSLAAAPGPDADRCQHADSNPGGPPSLGPPPTPGPGPRGPRAPAGGVDRPRAPAARGARRRRRGAPWDQPPPSSGLAPTGEEGAAPPLGDPASHQPNPPETSVCPVLPGLRVSSPGRRHGGPLRAAYAASGWCVAFTLTSSPRWQPQLPVCAPRRPAATLEAAGESRRDQ